MAKIQFAEASGFADIRFDNVFRAVFTRNTPASQGALSKLVSALTGREVSVLDILANKLSADNIRDRQIRFDINCRAENGEPMNVKMSLNPDPFEPVRLEFYTGRLNAGWDMGGSEKSYDGLKQACQIAILAKERFFQGDILLHAFEYYDPFHEVALNRRSRIITLELFKVDKAEKPVEGMGPMEYRAEYFWYLILIK